MRKEKGGKRGKKKMDEWQEEREKEVGEWEERTEEKTERTEEGIKRHMNVQKLLRKLAKKMRGVRKIQSAT